MGQNISKCWGVISVTYSSDGIELPLKVKLRVQYQGSNYGTQFKFQLKNSFYFPSFQHVVTPRNGEPTTLKLRMERNPNASFANFSPIFQLFINGDYYEHNLTEIRMDTFSNDFNIPTLRKILLAGASGCGKSSLITDFLTLVHNSNDVINAVVVKGDNGGDHVTHKIKEFRISDSLIVVDACGSQLPQADDAPIHNHNHLANGPFYIKYLRNIMNGAHPNGFDEMSFHAQGFNAENYNVLPEIPENRRHDLVFVISYDETLPTVLDEHESPRLFKMKQILDAFREYTPKLIVSKCEVHDHSVSFFHKKVKGDYIDNQSSRLRAHRTALKIALNLRGSDIFYCENYQDQRYKTFQIDKVHYEILRTICKHAIHRFDLE